MFYKLAFCPRCGQKYRFTAELIRPHLTCLKCRYEFWSPRNAKIILRRSKGGPIRFLGRN